MQRSLKFTPVEELMLHQDSSAYPYTCFMRMKFAGRMDRDSFRSAATRALKRHPLLAASIDNQRRIPSWQMPDDPTPDIVWRDGEVTDEFPETGYLDPSESGLRIHVTHNEEATDVVLQWIHACCDGLGMVQFARDLLVLFAAERGEAVDESSLPRADLTRLAGRGAFGLTWSKLATMARKQAIGIAGVRQFLSRSPTPLMPGDRVSIESTTSEPYPAVCSWHFDKDTTSAFRNAARKQKATTNDLLASHLFSAIRRFRAEVGCGDDEQWLRMLVPFNLRKKEDRHLPAANVVSSVFLDRRGVEIDDASELLQSVKDEMQLIKDNELGFTFVFSLHANRLMPGGLRRTARGDNCNSSVVFTNLGRILTRPPLPKEDGELICGGCRLKKIEILAPMTRLTDVAFSAAWYANRLSICLHYDPRPLTAEQAQRLLNLFVDEITQSARRSQHELNV